MSKSLYLECNAGISGDMFVAAMLDLGADQNILRQTLDSIPIDGYEIKIGRVLKSGLDACDFSVLLDQEHENHDHDMQYLHGQEQSHTQEHIHVQEHHHVHDQNHHHHHEHRGISEIKHIISHTEMTDQAKELASRIFDILADAESKAHGLPKDQVHFHEVGAVDSIVDIIAAAVCFDQLGIKDVIIPELSEGKGMIRCQHGMIPVPVPATVNIVSAHGIRLHPLNIEGEFVTPTGAAIAAAIKTSGNLPEVYEINRIGIGAGKREYERPSILRAMILENQEQNQDVIYKLETNIDDCSGEMLGYVMERLLKAGARDVNYMPVYMKKNRPAYQLNVICAEEDMQLMEQIIFKETTTIGIRRMKMERTILPRMIENFQSSYGNVQIKKCKIKDVIRIYPEYESIKQLAESCGISYHDLYQKILLEWNEKNDQ
jgi:hypothetical protein